MGGGNGFSPTLPTPLVTSILNQQEYTHAERSNSVNTAWALLALVRARCSDGPALELAVRYLCAQQDASGDWPQDGGIAGIFNRTCGITYTSYRNVFPLWALAAYESDAAQRKG